MNDDAIIKHMIEYVEEIEKESQASKLFKDSKAIKKDVTSSIIKELDKCIENEN